MSVASLRPLTLLELQDLINSDIEGQQMAHPSVNVSDLIDQQCGSIMSITGGVVQFRHPRLRQSVLENSQTGLLAIHAEMTRLLLLYIQSFLVVSTIQFLLVLVQHILRKKLFIRENKTDRQKSSSSADIDYNLQRADV